MKPEEAASIWRRYLSEESISADESRQLLDAVERDDGFRAELLEDDETHWRLRALARSQDPEDTFVADFNRRIEGSHREQGAQADRATSRASPSRRRPWKRRRVVELSLAATFVVGAILSLWLSGLGSQGIASIAHAEDAVWSGAPPGERLQENQLLELQSGSVEIRFDHGASLRLEGPTELHVTREACRIQFGSIAASLPETGRRFRLETPVTVVQDQGVTFTLSVERDGATAIEALGGSLDMRRTDGSEEAIRLDPAGLSRASLFTREAASGLKPVITRASGVDGAFLGRISLDGKSVECRDPSSFQRLLDVVATRPSRHRLLEDWAELSQRFGVGATSRVSITVGGATFSATNLDEAVDVDQRLRELLGSLPEGTSFSGSIRVNGTRREFSSRADFEAARKTLTRPLLRFDMLSVDTEPSTSRRSESGTSGSVRTRSSYRDGRFRGEIEVDGKLRVIDDPDAYEQAVRDLRERR